MSRDLVQLLDDMDIDAKTVTRKSLSVIYIKESEVIADLIALMGATDAMIELLNVKMEKDYKKNINRQVNCENANADKIAAAAARQLTAIKKIQKTVGLKTLPDNLQEIALLRLANPEESLAKLASLSGLSRSGVNHRLKKISEIARELE